MKHWRIVLGTFIVLTLFGPFVPVIVTQWSFGLDFGRYDANEIGDTIGGILGPYFSFIGSCLVAYTIYLQLETRDEDKKKEFDKIIFENCLESIKNAELKIYELNATNPQKKWASNDYFDEYFNAVWNSDTLKVHLFMEGMNSAISLFNSSSITDEAYHVIIVNKVDRILDLVRANKLGKWNSSDIKDEERLHFFKRPISWQSYNEVKTFYSNIKDLKTNFNERFDENFQEQEITQLGKTTTWLQSFGTDLKSYIENQDKITDLAKKMFNGEILENPDEYDESVAVVDRIEAKYLL
jgi:hypothetical protein